MRKFIVFMMLCAGAAQAQVHRCTDAKTGKVTYSDTLCGGFFTPASKCFPYF